MGLFDLLISFTTQLINNYILCWHKKSLIFWSNMKIELKQPTQVILLEEWGVRLLRKCEKFILV